MTKNQLVFTDDSTMFGTRVRLQDAKNKYNEIIMETNTPSPNPFTRSNPTVDKAYTFHSPNIDRNGWEQTAHALTNVEGDFSVEATLDTKTNTVEAVLKVVEKEDAAVIAWTTTNIWEKWGDKEAKEAKKKNKPIKAKLGADGKLTAKVTVTELGKLS